MHLPSAGMSRFRFNGSASLHLSPIRAPRGKEEHSADAPRRKGGMRAPQCKGAMVSHRPFVDVSGVSDEAEAVLQVDHLGQGDLFQPQHVGR